MPGVVSSVRRVLADRALSAADTWERHLIVAELVGAPRTLVDVGGLPGQLAGFLPHTKTLAVNVGEPADMLVPLDHLPFEDGAFETATSLDVLEHVPPADRARFVGELLRVARGRTVLCCPLGTPEHVAAEDRARAWYRQLTAEDHPWLAEHAEHGLPTLEELRAAYAAHPGRVAFRFHGDIRVVDRQFRLGVLARERRRPADLVAYARFRLPYRPDVTLAEAPTAWTNRVFVVTDPPA